MARNICRSQNWSNDELPPSYTEVARLEHWPQLPSAWQNVSSRVSPDFTPPPSYSSLELSSLTSDCSPPVIPTAEANLLPKDPHTTVVTPKQLKHSVGGVPSYIVWSIVSTIIFPPLGVIALIYSLKVLIAQRNNNQSTAWKSHRTAGWVNLVATALGTFAFFYFAFTLPLMYPSPSTNSSVSGSVSGSVYRSVSRLGKRI